MIKELYKSTKAEILKYKGSYALALATLAPLFISSMLTVIYFLKAPDLVKNGKNGLTGMLNGSIQTSASMLFTFYLILLTVLIHQIEHKAHSLKDLFSYPVSYASTYLSKWIVSLILIGLSVVLYLIFSLVGFGIVELRYPSLFWFDADVFLLFVKQVFFVMLASMMILGIQFLVSLRWNNVILPLSVGVTGFISAMILVNGWKYVHFYPYALGLETFMATVGKTAVSLNFLMGYSLAGLALLIAGGYFMWYKRRII